MTKLSLLDCDSFLLEHQIENMRVFMNSLSLFLSMSHTIFSVFPDIFSSTIDRSWSFNKIHEWRKCTNGVKMVFSRSHNFQLRYQIGA
jgi:hypothetical protein